MFRRVRSVSDGPSRAADGPPPPLTVAASLVGVQGVVLVVLANAFSLAPPYLIKRAIEHAPGEAVTVLAHSLGGVACVDLLAMEDLDGRVDQLITVGSQAPFFYECGALASVEHPKTLPGHFPRRWLNIYDPWDLLAYRAAKVFPQHASDVEVSNGQPFPFAHSAYWSNSKVWDAIGTWLD